MSDERVLEGEILVTDVLLSLNKLTDVERQIYEFNLQNAKFLRQEIDSTTKPTVVEMTLLFRHVLNFGLSQKAIAAWYGTTTGTLSRWVSGENPPREFMRPVIVQQLGEIVDYIIRRLEAYRKRPAFRPQHQSGRNVVRLR